MSWNIHISCVISLNSYDVNHKQNGSLHSRFVCVKVIQRPYSDSQLIWYIGSCNEYEWVPTSRITILHELRCRRECYLGIPDTQDKPIPVRRLLKHGEIHDRHPRPARPTLWISEFLNCCEKINSYIYAFILNEYSVRLITNLCSIGWLVRASGDKQLILFCPVHRRVYSTVCSVLSECLWKNFTGDSGGIRTHDLLLTSADVLTYVMFNLTGHV